MKDSKPSPEQPHPQPDKADLAPDSNGHHQNPSPDFPAITPPASRWSEIQTWLEMRRGLLEITTEEEELEQLKEDGEMFRVEWRADLALKVFKYVLVALVTLTILGLEIALFIASPGIFAVNLLVGGVLAWRQIARRERREQQGDEREEDP